MFGKSRPIAFDPYKGRRARRGIPRWLLLLIVGTVAGAAGVLVLQQRVLPPRLSASESTALRSAFEQAEAERVRLQGELSDRAQQLARTQAAAKRASDELAASRTAIATLRADLDDVVDALPPDPRGGKVEMRAGRFEVADGKLEYELVLTRKSSSDKPLNAVMQLVVSGAGARGTPANHSPKPVSLSMTDHHVLRGSVDLPEGFAAREAQIQVLDRPAGKTLGMRVMTVQSAKAAR